MKHEPRPLPQELRWIESVSKMMDSAFRIPFTNITFGIDPLIGMVPGLGDGISFGISALIILAVVRQGIPVSLALRMVGNLLIDAAMGTLPVAGDLLDFVSKANQRNIKLLREYYGEHPQDVGLDMPTTSDQASKGSALALMGIGALLLLLGSAALFGLFKFWEWVWATFQ